MMDTTYFLAILLIIIRILSFLGFSKVFFPSGTPNKLKIVLGIIISFSIVSSIDYSNIEAIKSNYDLIVVIISEIITGFVFGIIVDISFKIIIFAGSLLDLHIGLSMVNMVDPNSQTSTTINGNLLHYIALVIFFTMNGHHLILKSIIESFSLLPLGESILYVDTIWVVVDIIVNYFVIGLKIAIPIVLIIILTDLSMGLISRAVPQINVMILGMPVKMLVGLLSISVGLPLMIKIFASNISYFPEIFRKILGTIPLIFFIASDDKTEEATPKKKSDSRKKGQVARSKDASLAITLVMTILALLLMSDTIVSSLRKNVIYFLSESSTIQVTEGYIPSMVILMLSKFAIAILPIVLPIMVAGVAASLAQTGFLVVKDAIKPKFSKLNPINGFKNMFSKKTFVELAKNLITISIIIYVAYKYIRDNYYKIMNFGSLYLPTLGTEVKSLFMGIFYKVAVFVVAIAAMDYLVQVLMFRKDMKMSKQEIKEEYKQTEGDPQIKGKIKQKQKEMARRRMMDSVGNATVVITNPTHLAIAIMYEEGKTKAPKVVAKGSDLVALKIKEKAKENNVPIIENKPLARLMYDQVDIDDDIPQDMYQAVAEILAMVYKLDKGKRHKR